jgi:hypothetical protein
MACGHWSQERHAGVSRDGEPGACVEKDDSGLQQWATWTADHLPQRAAGMPRSSSPAAMVRSDSQPAACGSAMVGARSSCCALAPVGPHARPPVPRPSIARPDRPQASHRAAWQPQEPPSCEPRSVRRIVPAGTSRKMYSALAKSAADFNAPSKCGSVSSTNRQALVLPMSRYYDIADVGATQRQRVMSGSWHEREVPSYTNREVPSYTINVARLR